MQSSFNPAGQLTIEDIILWMDGGSVTLITRDSESESFKIEFVQKVVLKKQEGLPYPGSLLLNENEIEIRSGLETKILAAIKNAIWGPKLVDSKNKLLKQVVNEYLEFVTSDNYIKIAKQVGRMN